MNAMENAMENDVLERLGHVARTERASLVRVARTEGLGAEDAVDCMHDALCTFLRLAQKDDLPNDLHAFLATIVRNAARNKRRLHHLSRPHDSIDAIEHDGNAPLAEEMIVKAEEHVRLRACVERLCETQRAVVTLRMLDERDGEDVATALGITRGHVDVLLHRAKGALLVCMTE